MNLLNILPRDWFLHRQVALHIIKYRKLLLAYSGGLDSTVLLDILTTLRNINNNYYSTSLSLTFRAIHIHHNFHRYADTWAEHCNQQCKARNVSFQVICIKDFYDTNKVKSNIESLLRFFRYQKLYDHLHSKEIILTAHHMNDQVETLFLSLKRGSGPTGLSGMNINTLYYHKYRILRPLLQCSRMQLEKYAFDNNLSWVQDETNNNIRFDRNFLRIKVLPILYSRWPFFERVVTRTTELCRNQDNLLQELLFESLNQLVDVTNNALYFEPFFKFSILKRQALLRLWIIKFFMNIPSYQLINRIWKEVILSRQDSAPALRFNQYLCRRFRKKLYFIPISMTVPIKTIKLLWKKSNDKIMLPYNLGLLTSQYLIFNENLFKNTLFLNKNINFILNLFFEICKKPGKILTHCVVRSPKSDEQVSVQFGCVSGLLHILNRNKGRKLKKIWQELGIPPWLRTRIPLLFYNCTLISAIGVFITREGSIINNNMNEVFQISWLQDELYYKFFKHSLHNYLK